ncbi:helix-turn-helix domain-containing protein [Paenibacillus sp. PK3_47]|uniref:helix-turn-helix domain-containing protein n=1 Tax=Paenibacillus sp. PK3_47 TaxID=2072642 RepID=UPI00201D5A35|nr:helix-turn-helix domain-containing protein [Paenibacillus sp. PK3_47]
MERKNIAAAEKLAILQEIKEGVIGLNAAVGKFGVSKSSIQEWRRRYKAYGYPGLETRTHNRTYSAELKRKAVKDVLEGGLSQTQVIYKYQIASQTQLANWIKKYNGHSKSLTANSGGTKAMTKGRLTTWQERIDIVQYCLAHQLDYTKTASQFKVSYPQVYSWVKKYQSGGDDALRDGRGRTKAPEELTEADRYKLAMKKLEYENERLRAENALLKKLDEIERRRL